MNAAVIVAIAAIVGAPLLSYLVATRKLSGKIATTEASRLWDASEELRRDYRDRLAVEQARTARLEERVAHLDSENLTLKQRILDLEALIQKGSA